MTPLESPATTRPRTSFPDGEPLRQFMAIARVTDDEPHQAAMRPDFQPWRRLVEPIRATPAPIALLITRAMNAET